MKTDVPPFSLQFVFPASLAIKDKITSPLCGVTCPHAFWVPGRPKGIDTCNAIPKNVKIIIIIIIIIMLVVFDLM